MDDGSKPWDCPIWRLKEIREVLRWRATMRDSVGKLSAYHGDTEGEDGIFRAVVLILTLEEQAWGVAATFHDPATPLPSCPDTLDALAEIWHSLRDPHEEDSCRVQIGLLAESWYERLIGPERKPADGVKIAP